MTATNKIAIKYTALLPFLVGVRALTAANKKTFGLFFKKHLLLQFNSAILILSRREWSRWLELESYKC